MHELTRILPRLAANKVEFIVAGGLAVVLHGSSLMTRDIDVVCRFTPDNLERLFLALEELKPRHRMTAQKTPFTREQALSGTLRNLYLSTDWGQLDCLGEIKGLGSYDACLAASESFALGEEDFRILTLDALIVAKRAMQRPRDLHAVLELEAIRERRRGG